MYKKEFSIEVGGKTMTAMFTDWASQANGSVIVRYGNSAVLATAVIGNERTGIDYFPLSVEYEERFYAAGAILGSRFQRREGRPSDEAVLSGRVVDRTIRPLFEQHIRREVQVVITVLAIDQDDTDVLGVIAASLALGTSNIPWNGPVSAVRIGKMKDGETFSINPTYADRDAENAELDLLACGKDGLINMIEVGANEIPEAQLEQVFALAVEEHNKLQVWQQGIIAEIGKQKLNITKREPSPSIATAFAEHIGPKLLDAVFSNGAGKAGINALKEEWEGIYGALEDVVEADAEDYFENAVNDIVHMEAIKNERRPDGRKLDEIRPLFAQAGGISEMIHGTGLFYRGDTHIFSALTLGGPGDAQLLDTIESQEASKRFMHHYNFPPFSVGETGRVGGMNRRAIGHGALAEKGLRAVIPAKDAFPYTIRIVSETLSSNGSSSMGSVCASTLALMDAGVPIKRPVAGMAMGMMSEGDVYKILTDIQGPEDHHGDMDFKVAGTTEGVTAVQMDVKVGGVPVPVLGQALAQAKKARLEIIDVLLKAMPAPRTDISPRAPKIITMKVKVDQIGLVIGPGGKMINGIKDRTKVDEITIEDDGTVFITGKNGTAEAAAKEIFDLTREYSVGERFEGEVTRMLDFGAFVKIGPNTEGLVHVSEVAPFRIAKISDAVKIGEVVPVVIKEIDEKGRYNLSIKGADPEFASRKGLTEAPPGNYDRRSNSGENGRGGRR